MNGKGKARSQATTPRDSGEVEPILAASSSDAALPALRSEIHKKKTLVLSVPARLEGLVAVLLGIATIVFLAMSAHTLYQFPVPDSYRWYGDESWLMLEWRSLLTHGQMIVPVALQSTLLRSPGLLLGSSWLTAVVYGIPQLLLPPRFDPVSTGRTISFIIAIATTGVIGWAGYRWKWRGTITILAIALLATSRAFTFASHSARYDVITGFVVILFVFFFAVRIEGPFGSQPKRGAIFAFLLGFITVLLGLTVSPHVGALLLLPAIFITWYFGGLKTIRAMGALVFGCALGIALLALVYVARNHHLVIFGLVSGRNQMNSYLQHLPVSRLFSWSAERHQFSAKFYYLWHNAPPFAVVLPFILLSELLLLLRRQQHASTLFVTICLAGVLVGSAFFQSTLPYYLNHFLPLTAATFAAHLQEWHGDKARAVVWFRALVALTSIIVIAELFGLWLPELRNAGRMGKQLDEANTAAIEASVEFASRSWVHGTHHPLVLAQAPAIHQLLRDTSIRVMSEAFLFFPLYPGKPVDSVIRGAPVNYILDYNKPMTTEYERAVQQGKPIFRRAGHFLDRTLSYFQDTTSELDTLTMYEIKPVQ